MGLKKILRMNQGNGKTSYANNSGFQDVVISKTWDVAAETLRNMFESDDGLPDYCMNIVDLGCASGPNTLSVVSRVMDKIQDLCKNCTGLQEHRFFLNDLPDNDFNSLFKLVEIFKHENELVWGSKSQCYVYGLPGSFYGRLFPRKSLHFVYSSCSLHWLSQVPQGLGSQNKENIYIALTSPLEVLDAYAEQYRRDLVAFLSARGEEMAAGGRMVLTFVGRRFEDLSSQDESCHLSMLSQTLLDMVGLGLVEKDDLYSFNVPIYMPCQQEVESMINHQGSFIIDKIVAFPARWDANKHADGLPFDKNRSRKLAADCIRAFMEPMIVSHFGKSIDCDDLFERYAERLGEHLSKERSAAYHMLSISLNMR